ncbi:MAG: hypothetical protein ACHQC8_01900 [Solirubrobacterales bacterium]
MPSSSPHIPFPVASAALHADRLAWLLEHARQISMDHDFEIAVCELISRKDPDHLLKGSAEFVQRVAAQRDRQELGQ